VAAWLLDRASWMYRRVFADEKIRAGNCGIPADRSASGRSAKRECQSWARECLPLGPKRTFHMSHLVSPLGVKRTCHFAPHMSAFDPKQTLSVGINSTKKQFPYGPTAPLVGLGIKNGFNHNFLNSGGLYEAYGISCRSCHSFVCVIDRVHRSADRTHPTRGARYRG